VFPLFMADGWFTETHLPERLRAAGAVDPAMRVPFGLVPALQDLVLTRAREAAAEAGRTPGETAVLLAAHGSFRSPAPARVARAVAARLVAEAGFARAEAAFIDQEPRIADAARAMPEGALCLPFFAARGGHVIDDLPAALSEGGFRGSALPPIGLDPRVPALIAAAIAGG
jgi:sirohydrochlorin ferrochelatase